MITVWEEFFRTASEFSEEEQKIMANRWLSEMKLPDFMEIIRDDMKWEQSFSESQDVLEMMADKALKEIGEGKAEQIGGPEQDAERSECPAVMTGIPGETFPAPQGGRRSAGL